MFSSSHYLLLLEESAKTMGRYARYGHIGIFDDDRLLTLAGYKVFWRSAEREPRPRALLQMQSTRAFTSMAYDNKVLFSIQFVY